MAGTKISLDIAMYVLFVTENLINLNTHHVNTFEGTFLLFLMIQIFVFLFVTIGIDCLINLKKMYINCCNKVDRYRFGTRTEHQIINAIVVQNV